MAKQKETSADHHSVPRFVLRPWTVPNARGQELLHGYWWNERKQELWCRQRGVSGFCVHEHLLSLKRHTEGPDAIERMFFGEVDTQGAAARNKMLSRGPESLSSEERSAFARVMMSLEARRPPLVRRLRDGGKYMADSLDNDPKILEGMVEYGLTGRPSEIVEQQYSLQDKALTIIQSVVDNPTIGQRLINAHWEIRELGRWDGTLVLSDRPLVRKGDFENKNILWYLPLSPTHAFMLLDRKEHINSIRQRTGQRFAKSSNVEVARQADQFVFATDPAHRLWIETVLRKRPPAPPLPPALVAKVLER
jgi:hypothetical protein